MKKEAMLYIASADNQVRCNLCAHKCQIAPGKSGVCGVRQNQEGKLYTQVYGEVIAAHIDPIEKKPLFHFLPGSKSFSMATIGCNFRCSFCQNWQISQNSKTKMPNFSGRRLSPAEIVSLAKAQDCRSISYTYTEPTIFFEYAYDTAQLAKKEGLANVFVTNGYMSVQALDTFHPHLDACNVDLKSFREEYYQSLCGAHLQPVLESIRHMKALGIWVEITTLVVPDQNDSQAELDKIAAFIADVDPNIPWHISRFHPDFKYLDSYPTPIETLQNAFSIGKGHGLHYIFIGNVWGESEDTICPECSRAVVRRSGFAITANKLEDSRCPFCSTPIAGVF